MSGISNQTNNAPMNNVGMVSAYFQARSHQRCMKNVITNMALAADMTIIAVQPVTG